MALKLGDIFIGDYLITQKFGERPEYYKQFGLAGHDGVDFGCPVGTLLISPFDGIVIKDIDTTNNPVGNYCKVWDPIQMCAVLYGHMRENIVSVGQKVIKGQLLGHSGNTGTSTTGAHLHFGLVKTDKEGLRLDKDNGFAGYINPLDKRIVTWETAGLTEPVTPPDIISPIPAEPNVTMQTKIPQITDKFGNPMEVQKIKSELDDNQIRLLSNATAIGSLGSFRDGVAMQLRIGGETDTNKIATELSKMIEESDRVQQEAACGLELFEEIAALLKDKTYVWFSSTDQLIEDFKKQNTDKENLTSSLTSLVDEIKNRIECTSNEPKVILEALESHTVNLPQNGGVSDPEYPNLYRMFVEFIKKIFKGGGNK